MVKSAYSFIKQAIRQKLKKRLIDWRKSNAIVKIEKPTDIGRARKLGYKDKKGFVVVRVRLKRGGRKKPRRRKGRRSKRQTIRKTLKMNYQWVAEQRAARKFTNLEVLNSYKIGKDGQNYFFEVIMVDPNRPEIKSDKTINWICKPENRGRVFRGITSAGKKSRGLRKKGKKLKVRPSIRARERRGK
jgi:large subunit ribosomal protein L15e